MITCGGSVVMAACGDGYIRGDGGGRMVAIGNGDGCK